MSKNDLQTAILIAKHSEALGKLIGMSGADILARCAGEPAKGEDESLFDSSVQMLMLEPTPRLVSGAKAKAPRKKRNKLDVQHVADYCAETFSNEAWGFEIERDQLAEATGAERYAMDRQLDSINELLAESVGWVWERLPGARGRGGTPTIYKIRKAK